MRALLAGIVVLIAGTSFVFAAPEAKPGVKPAGKSKTATTAPASAKKLSPDEIKAAFFDGKPFIASTPAGVKYKMTFQPDGKMSREPDGKTGQLGEGSWSLSKDGFCTAWKGSKQNCYKLFASGENQWSVSNGSSALATWSR